MFRFWKWVALKSLPFESIQNPVDYSHCQQNWAREERPFQMPTSKYFSQSHLESGRFQAIGEVSRIFGKVGASHSVYISILHLPGPYFNFIGAGKMFLRTETTAIHSSIHFILSLHLLLPLF